MCVVGGTVHGMTGVPGKGCILNWPVDATLKMAYCRVDSMAHMFGLAAACVDTCIKAAVRLTATWQKSVLLKAVYTCVDRSAVTWQRQCFCDLRNDSGGCAAT